MTAQGNALGWRYLKMALALKGRNMEVKSEKQSEKSMIHYSLQLSLPLQGGCS
jgi:hypothetical protein